MKLFFRSLLSTLLLSFVFAQLSAQSGRYGNEWIDYSKTYYKFKVAKSGVYRISKAALTAANVPETTPGSRFLLYRDGKEVPLYVSAETMTGADYIEFIGRGPDGLLDKELYEDTTWQPDTRICLYTDTAAYYLTYDNGTTAHARYTEQPNTIPATPPPAEMYNWTTVGNYYKNVITEGPSYDNAPFFSPSFENGEGFVAQQMDRGATAALTLLTPNLAGVPGINAILNTSVTTRSHTVTHAMNVAVNGNMVASGSWGITETKHFNPAFPASQLSGTNTITYIPVNPMGTAYDIYGVSYVEIQYPRNFDVAGLPWHSFRLNAGSSAQYIEFTNFSSAARLYDITNQTWYAGNVSGTTTRFYIRPSLSDRDLMLVPAGAATAAINLNADKTFKFIDYTLPANQGDYLIVTHKKLMEPLSGRNYIQEYKDYRSSVAGGAHKATVADVTDLYDQFAYGYETHPLSIRHYLEYAYNTWSVKPVSVNIIGRGLQYEQYSAYYAAPATYTFPIVPVYGNPGSDVNYTNFGTTRSQKIQIGRVSVWNTDELSRYLTKIKSYEAVLKEGSDATALWKKNVMHLAGGTSAAEVADRRSTLNYGAGIVTDTLMGARVYNFDQNSTSPVSTVQRELVDSLINNGLNIITYFGHASPTALGYNLPDPETYHANPRFPVFLALGCDIAQMFGAFTAKTLSERYTLAATGGAVAMLATDNYGYTGFLDNYLYAYYRSNASVNYGATVGLHALKSNNEMFDFYKGDPNFKFYFTQIECQILTGDPAVPTFGPSKPDYHVADNSLTAIPGNVSTALDSFQLRITSYNLARAIHDTVTVTVNHVNPAGTNALIKTYQVINLLNTDTTTIWIPLNKTTDIGLNKYLVKIDAPNKFDEVNELNNDARLELFIYNDNLVPVYPYEFAIVHKPSVTLKASTLNPFRPSARYLMEIDTTTAFNSPSKLQTTIVSKGGLLKWTPSLIMKDSTVYYWRTAADSLVNGSQQWSVSSFIYLANGSDGWNQSHYFQYLRDGYNGINLDNSRAFRYNKVNNTLEVYNNIIYDDPNTEETKILYNGQQVQKGAQNPGTLNLQIMVIDSISGKILKNSATATGGALPPAGATNGTYMRQFNIATTAQREVVMHYLEDTIPNNSYIVIRNIIYSAAKYGIFTPAVYADTWKADTVVLGNGRSLYHTIRNLGFTTIDSFTSNRVFVFMTKKGDPTWPLQQRITSAPGEIIKMDAELSSLGAQGQVNSTVIGPAKAWQTLKWRRSAKDGRPENDTAVVAIYGIPASGPDTLIYSGYARDTSISFIPAAKYPKLRMEWQTTDSVTATAPQLDYWRVLYAPVPEAALNPAAHFVFSDTLQVGQRQQFEIAIENLTEVPMDSMLVNYKIINANGITSFLDSQRYRPLPGLDTLHATLNFDPAAYPGSNFLFIEANPGNDQPEQYHPNNLGYLHFGIGTDKNNPLLDVTFDGIHILTGDIVSSKPFIKVTLKDENKYLALDTSGLFNVTLKRTSPISSTIALPFDGKTCKFIPGQAGANGKNEAVIEIRTELEDGKYTLSVEGSDKSGNGAGTPQGTAGRAKYVTDFEVINKATVSNVLNYPNPFSTATAFLFTITGSQIPSQFKIQILSVTGKVVREITKNELGPLHIGRNITEYKWDGRDQFGQLLGNGVYMYRVATSLNGNSIEHRDDMDQKADNSGSKFFKNGYGKMYIMR